MSGLGIALFLDPEDIGHCRRDARYHRGVEQFYHERDDAGLFGQQPFPPPFPFWKFLLPFTVSRRV